MINWLKNLSDASRLTSINEASRISGISAKAIEKDWWVTLSLKLLFNTPFAKYFAMDLVVTYIEKGVVYEEQPDGSKIQIDIVDTKPANITLKKGMILHGK
jgi:hypothetical protein